MEKRSKLEEKKAVERAVAHVERIRKQKQVAHDEAIKEIEQIKLAAKKKHEEIDLATAKATQDVINKATKGVMNLDEVILK